MKVNLRILLTWNQVLSWLQLMRLNRQDRVFFHFWDKAKPSPFWGGAWISVCPLKTSELSCNKKLREEHYVQLKAGLHFCYSCSGEIGFHMTLLSKDHFLSIWVHREAFSKLAKLTGKSFHFSLHLFDNNMTLLIPNIYTRWLSRDVLL